MMHFPWNSYGPYHACRTNCHRRRINSHFASYYLYVHAPVATLLRAADHRVDALDLAASGADARRLREAPTFEDYSRPLLDAVRALPDGERAVLVGHSFGGMSVALAAEELPEKVAAAVFVTALMPDCAKPRPDVIEKVPLSDWMDCVMDAEHEPPSVLFGPDFMRRKLYHLSPEEDFTLSQSLLRLSSYYVADMHRRPPFSEARYGAVRKVYVVCGQDQVIVEAYQRRMIADCPVAEVREIAAADHMAMFSAPEELAGHLADVANTYA
ncbi:hypothetical protein E2562_021609 [Oryza meyeriana var. granulata]|uniref:AB hydrolase-1 domain-containing protein n=1 Tax=Oryza meyeriana var. granulata TaxID=110450 RepID=A0A6G1E1S3_9ORYZ|nr:hypothetical protein E2562_021609 [Oryza meyeriana var. granulata]